MTFGDGAKLASFQNAKIIIRLFVHCCVEHEWHAVIVRKPANCPIHQLDLYSKKYQPPKRYCNTLKFWVTRAVLEVDDGSAFSGLLLIPLRSIAWAGKSETCFKFDQE